MEDGDSGNTVHTTKQSAILLCLQIGCDDVSDSQPAEDSNNSNMFGVDIENGVAVVQIETPSTKASTVVIHSPAARFQGLLASLLGSFTSGLAGVYFELVLKSSQGSIWLRNVQIATFSIIPALIGMIYVDGSKILTTGPFYGYNIWTILTILDQALGGLLVAVVVKYADNILKGFATSLSIIISSIVSVYLFGMRMSLFFTFGATLVVAAAYVYGVTPTKPTK
ncbi:UDP-galactose translocator [Zancudomyces culisetae]|uniref:UDP-galactose translocator n=1 Tax=Zancudomyces culisetae TaxID=1213189 RepID=A0A1R1PSC0_ZANCU|nr:UDP-galactose translocator [Zancudomyces culisetae]|eukprot:OMH83858.1 UDP-galactose translocator [Zancudomyces culisetae]